MASLSASIVLAEDFKTVNGKEYKNATVNRVEPDGIVIKFHGGIVKLQFAELSADVQKKYGYDPVAAKRYEASLREAAMPRATPTPDSGVRNAEDAFNVGWKHGYGAGHLDGEIFIKVHDLGGNPPQVPTGDEVNRRAWENARGWNVPFEFKERYREGYRSGFEQGYKDAARPAF